MIPAISSALAGLDLHRRRVDAASQNLANAGTEGYRAVQVTAREGPGGAPAARVERPDAPGPAVLEERRGPVERSNVDLTREVTGLLSGQRGFEVSLKSLQAGDDLVGVLLDLKR